MIRTELKRGTAELAILSVLEQQPSTATKSLAASNTIPGRPPLHPRRALSAPLSHGKSRLAAREWETGDNGRRRRCYKLLPRGRKMLAPLRAEWSDLFRAMRRVARVNHADWLAYVNGRLGRLSLPEVESAQVREELAAHLEDTYLSLRAQGVSESDAVRLACDQVPVGWNFAATFSRQNWRLSCKTASRKSGFPGSSLYSLRMFSWR